jgi:sialidase-1
MGGFAGTGVNESKALQLGDGTVLQNMRHNSAPMRFLARSKDGAQTFGPMRAAPQLVDPGVNADEIARGNTLYFVNAADARARRNLTLRASCDGGRTWAVKQLLQSGPAAYAVLAALPDGAVGVMYEAGARNPYEKILFARVRLRCNAL